AVMAGFGGVISEVGASMMVGGNIKGSTRVLTTATVLETGKGNFDIAIALSAILLLIPFLVNWALTWIQQRARPRSGGRPVVADVVYATMAAHAIHSEDRTMSAEVLTAVWLSARVAVAATVLNALLGIPLAYLLARRRFWGRGLVDLLVTLPLVLPPTVTGYYLIVLL